LFKSFLYLSFILQLECQRKRCDCG